MPNYDFNTDLPIARKTEKQIATYLESKGIKFISECNNSDYDLLVELPNGRQVTIEIKEDFTCERTGNIGVESESWGRLSGISVSKANFYLYKIHEPSGLISLYLIETSKLKKMIKDELWHREVVGGDPGSNSRNYLFRLDVVKDNFKCIGRLDS